MKYLVDYEYGRGVLYSACSISKAVDRFCELGSECFGLRKSLGKLTLIECSDEKPKYMLDDEYERIEHNGDVIVWNKFGTKIKSVWD